MAGETELIDMISRALPSYTDSHQGSRGEGHATEQVKSDS